MIIYNIAEERFIFLPPSSYIFLATSPSLSLHSKFKKKKKNTLLLSKKNSGGAYLAVYPPAYVCKDFSASLSVP